MYLVAFLLCAIAFSLTPDGQNQRLKQTNRALLNALKEMSVGDQLSLLRTIPPQSSSSDRSEQEMSCPHGDHPTFYSNPDDCGSYFMCDAGGIPQPMSCPAGLWWNGNINVCDWPTKVDCEVSEEASESVECEEGSIDCQVSETDVSQLHGVKYVEPQADNVCSEGSSWSSALQRCVSTTGKDCGLCISTCTAMARYSGSDCRAMCASDCQGSEVSVGLTKSDLIESIAAKTRLSGKEVEDAVADILSNMSSALEAGDRIEIRGFGSFSSLYQATKKSGNPKPGYQPARGKYVPSFNPAEDLRERVNNGNVETAVFWTNLNLNRQAKAIVELFFEEIGMALESGESVHLSGFGNFELYEKNERPGRNPKTGEDEPITARTAVTFLPGPRLKALVANIEL